MSRVRQHKDYFFQEIDTAVRGVSALSVREMHGADAWSGSMADARSLPPAQRHPRRRGAGLSAAEDAEQGGGISVGRGGRRGGPGGGARRRRRGGKRCRQRQPVRMGRQRSPIGRHSAWHPHAEERLVFRRRNAGAETMPGLAVGSGGSNVWTLPDMCWQMVGYVSPRRGLGQGRRGQPRTQRGSCDQRNEHAQRGDNRDGRPPPRSHVISPKLHSGANVTRKA